MGLARNKDCVQNFGEETLWKTATLKTAKDKLIICDGGKWRLISLAAYPIAGFGICGVEMPSSPATVIVTSIKTGICTIKFRWLKIQMPRFSRSVPALNVSKKMCIYTYWCNPQPERYYFNSQWVRSDGKVITCGRGTEHTTEVNAPHTMHDQNMRTQLKKNSSFSCLLG